MRSEQQCQLRPGRGDDPLHARDNRGLGQPGIQVGSLRWDSASAHRCLSMEASYHRRWFGNIRVLDNLDVTPADYDPYCVTTPVDSRLPGGGGQSLCGFADIRPAKLGLNTNEWIRADDLGARQVFNGVDVNVNARLPRGVVLQGGVSVGRLAASVIPDAAVGVAAGTQPLRATCFVVDSPQVRELCNENPPFPAQVKGSAVVPLPWW